MTTLSHLGHGWLKTLARNQLKTLSNANYWIQYQRKSVRNSGGITRIHLGQVIHDSSVPKESEMYLYWYERDTNLGPLPSSNQLYHYHWPHALTKEVVGTVLAGSLRLAAFVHLYQPSHDTMPFSKFTLHPRPEFSQTCHLKLAHVSTLLKQGFFGINSQEIHSWYPSRQTHSVKLTLEAPTQVSAVPAVFAPLDRSFTIVGQHRQLENALKWKPVTEQEYWNLLKQLQYLSE